MSACSYLLLNNFPNGTLESRTALLDNLFVGSSSSCTNSLIGLAEVIFHKMLKEKRWHNQTPWDHEWGLVSRDGRTNVKKEAQGNRKEKAACGQRRPIVVRLAGAKSHGWVLSTKDNNITLARLQAPVMGCRPKQRLTLAFRSFWDRVPALTLTEWDLYRSTQ